MDNSILEILSAVGIDFLVFLMLLLGFALYRKLRSPAISVSFDIALKKPFLYEGDYSTMEIAKNVVDMRLSKIYSSLGEWGLLYMIFHKFIIYSIGIMCLLGCGVLVPIYLVGEISADTDFHKTGIRHIITDEMLLIAPLLFIFVFSVIIYAFAAAYYKYFMKMNTDDVIHPSHDYVICVKGIDKQCSPKEMDGMIEKVLISQRGYGVVSVYTLPNYAQTYEKYLKLIEYQNKIKFLKLDLETKGKRVQILNRNLINVDGIGYYEKKVLKKQKKVEEFREKFKNENAGISFVVLENKKLVNEILLTGIGPSDFINTSAWTVKKAPSPGDIIWENYKNSKSSSLIIRIFANLGFIVVFLIILTPTVFETIIDNIFDYFGLDFIGGLIASYFPTLLLVVYQQLILPLVIEFLVSMEKHSKKHRAISSGLKKYMFYMVFYIFLYPLLGQQFLGFLSLLITDNEWQDEFAFKINETGQMFTIFLVHQAFMKNGWDLMVAGKYITSKARAIVAATTTEAELAYQSDPFPFDMEFAISLNVLIITCSFCIVYPLILLPSFAFFALRVISI